MPANGFAQQNAYRGSPPRAWVRLRFAAVDGTCFERELLVDTGSPCGVILGQEDFLLLHRETTTAVNSNFGPMMAAWLQLDMPDLNLLDDVLGYASDNVLQAAKNSCSDFAGLVGLPLLRMIEYGGDSQKFWMRQLQT